MTARSVVVLLALAACKNAPAETSTTSATGATGTATVSTAEATDKDLTWTMPPTWQVEPSGGMRKAAFRVTKVAGDTEDALVTVIAAGGTVDDNIKRWKTQFDAPHDAARSERKVGELMVAIAEVHGTYTGGGVMVGESPNARPGWALVGAIVPGSSQSYFFKMLGPDKTVAAARSDFTALVDSIRQK